MQYPRLPFQVSISKEVLYKLFSPFQKLYIPNTLKIVILLWHTQLIVCAENVKLWFKSWVFPFTFQDYILPHTLNCNI